MHVRKKGFRAKPSQCVPNVRSDIGRRSRRRSVSKVPMEGGGGPMRGQRGGRNRNPPRPQRGNGGGGDMPPGLCVFSNYKVPRCRSSETGAAAPVTRAARARSAARTRAHVGATRTGMRMCVGIRVRTGGRAGAAHECTHALPLAPLGGVVAASRRGGSPHPRPSAPPRKPRPRRRRTPRRPTAADRPATQGIATTPP